VFLRLSQDRLEDFPGAVVSDPTAQFDGLVVVGHSGQFELQVVLELLLHISANPDHVIARNLGSAVEEQDAVDELLGVLHLPHRFLVVLLAEAVKAPVHAHLGLAEILIDGRQLDRQGPVQRFDDFGFAFHPSRTPTAHRLDSHHAHMPHQPHHFHGARISRSTSLRSQ